MSRNILFAGATCVLLAACAGRDPRPVSVVQPVDAMLDCTAIQAELAADEATKLGLDNESSATAAKNVAFGVTGMVLFWPALFAMDLKDAAGVEAKAMVQRESYLTTLAAQRCGPPQPPVGYQPQALRY
jgi:hypothetical protein